MCAMATIKVVDKDIIAKACAVNKCLYSVLGINMEGRKGLVFDDICIFLIFAPDFLIFSPFPIVDHNDVC